MKMNMAFRRHLAEGDAGKTVLFEFARGGKHAIAARAECGLTRSAEARRDPLFAGLLRGIRAQEPPPLQAGTGALDPLPLPAR